MATPLNFTKLDQKVALFRAGSPNIAAAFDEVKALLIQLQGGSPPPGLPFAEASLRAGYVSLTTSDIPVGVSDYTLPTTADYLIDLGWIKRDRGLKIRTRAGQRVHAKNVYIDVRSSSVGSAYVRGGFGYRPQSITAAPSEHLSLTGYLVTGPWLTDGLTFGDSGQTVGPGATKVTFQMCRVENSSLVNGGVPAAETVEHMDAFQMQGPLSQVEFGLCTLYRQWAVPSSHAGKGLMLNAYTATGRAYSVKLNQVNFRDYPGATRCGAAWIKDESEITMDLADVWSKVESTGVEAWASNSDLYLNTANQGGPNQGWTSSGTAPNRTASFPAASSVTGVVKEGLSPDGVDFVTRTDLGL